MGAADAVPGVSGGTVAFISGIYEELLESLRKLTPSALSILFTKGARPFWQHINGTFLLVLFSGVLISLATFARIVTYLLTHYPTLLWAFFFGLILSSSFWLLRQISHWNVGSMAMFGLGCLLAIALTLLTPVEAELNGMTVFLAGWVAICAMILPGISGSFILLLLGMYGPIMEAIKQPDLSLLGFFMLGCVLGLLSFSHLIAWMFRRFHTLTLALLTGFMLGSLNRVWPWKYTTVYRENLHGELVPLVQDNVTPSSYQALTGDDTFLLPALGLMLLAGLMIYLMETRVKVPD